VLWPNERKGEAVLLRASPGRPPTGSLFVPPDKLRPHSSSQMNESLFGSDLSYEDVIENFYAWEHQAIAGTEVVDRFSCLILESKPGQSDHSR
jgi:outer membrane lipoprotein-sorting protein